MTKSVVKSKTVWVNLILAILAFFPVVRELVSEELILQLIALINIVLRLVSKDKLKLI
jgi:hypothetical protein